MNKSLKRIIETSSFTVRKGKYAYVTVAKPPLIGNHFMVSKDENETTVVTEIKNLKHLNVIEKNKDDWSLIALNVSAPFYSFGFLATVSSSIAKKRMDVLIISTYSKDYIMVKYECLNRALSALRDLGFKKG